eukprot:TRINITY_DN17217_c0_g1_i1.p1 TRINITY_DN17217_c0_g1~~TRINITY_DN17217_c0_g1_i1.p1  ORF type:complete len:103 (-),score=39.17 TRINITY_DN17217_c0_g1_i1:105-377(-)
MATTAAAVVEPYQLTVRIPFASERHARIVYASVSVDKELKPDVINKTLSVEGNAFVGRFVSVDVRLLRTSVSSFFEAVTLATETINTFDT